MCSEDDSNYSHCGYSSGNWQGWEIMIVVLMLRGPAMMNCGGPALVIFSNKFGGEYAINGTYVSGPPFPPLFRA